MWSPFQLLMSSVTLSLPALCHNISLHWMKILLLCWFHWWQWFSNTLSIQLIQNTDKSIYEGQSWTRCFLNFLVKFRQSRHPALGMGVDIERKIRAHSGRDSSVSVSWPLLPPPGVFYQVNSHWMPVICAQQACTKLHFFHSTDCIHKSSLFRGQSEDALLEEEAESTWWSRGSPAGSISFGGPWILLYSLLIRENGKI